MASPNETTKRCTSCGMEKPAAAFRLRKNRKRGSALWWSCRQCTSDYDREKAIRLRYGISQAEYLALAASQGNACAICRRPPGKRRLHVDHNHVTGEVRGLLCYPCNSAIGHLGDNTERLAAAIRYLDRPGMGAFVPMTEVALRARSKGYRGVA